MRKIITAVGMLSFFVLTAQSCTVSAPGGPGGPGFGPGVGPVGACFVNPTNRVRFYRVEWLDGTGRARIFRVFPGARVRLAIGRAPAQYCFSTTPRALGRCLPGFTRRVIKNC